MNRMTKATQIPAHVKEAVNIRDRGTCVVCYRKGYPVAHVVRRSQGGMGIEQNIVCLCADCHRKFDEGKRQEREAAYVAIVSHLKGFYPSWNRDDMIFKRWTYDTDRDDP